MSEEQDKVFFRNFSLVVGGIAVMMVVFFVMAQIVVIDDEAEMEANAEEVAERTMPVGQVSVEGEESGDEMTGGEAAVADSGSPGEKIYKGLCVNCHGVASMASMIPQTGDAAAWDARIAKGKDTLYDHAINGFTGDMGMMPAKGGNPNLSDDDIKLAVDYMVSAVTGEGADAGASTETAAAETAVDGEKVYKGLCVNCHGVASLASMIPQTGDAAAWEARIAQGNDKLYEHAIKGFVGDMGMMPPKGGNVNLSDEEVKAAVDYIVKQAQ